MPVHDCHEVEKPKLHKQVGDVRAPDLPRAFHPQTSQQIWIGLVPLPRLARIGFLVDRHEPYPAYQPPYSLLFHEVSRRSAGAT